MDRQTVKVYVRAGAHGEERTISLHPPKEIAQFEWLQRGFAFDGNSVTFSVTPRTGIKDQPEDIPGYPPDSELAERGLEVIGRRRYSRPFVYPEGSSKRTLIQALQEFEAWLVEWLRTLGYNVEFT